MSGLLQPAANAGGAIGGATQPQQVSVSSIPTQFQPMAGQLGQIMSQVLSQGWQRPQNPYPYATDPFSQLYGGGSFGGSFGGFMPPSPTGQPIVNNGSGGLLPMKQDMLTNMPVPVNRTPAQDPTKLLGTVGQMDYMQAPGSQTRGTFGTDSGTFGPFQSTAPQAVSDGTYTAQSATPSYQNQTAGSTSPMGDIDTFLQNYYTNGGMQGTSGGAQGGGQSAPLTTAGFDLPSWGGPYAAPLTGGQQAALSGFSQLFNPQQIVNTQQMQNAITAAIGGNSVFNPQQSGSLQNAIMPFNTNSPLQQSFFGDMFGGSNQTPQGPSSPQGFVLPSNYQNSFRTALSAPSADQTQLFQTGESLMNSDLQKVIAKTREESSAFGLNPGSTDRSGAQITAAGDVINNFRLGQQQLGMQAFQDAEQRRIGALGLAPGTSQAGYMNALTGNLGNQNRLAALPYLQQADQQAFQNFMAVNEPAAQRANNALGYLPQFSNLPFQQAQGMYDIWGQAQNSADMQLQRMMNEYARTQGAGLNQMIALLGGTPPQSTQFGPSMLSQLGQLGLGLGSIFG